MGTISPLAIEPALHATTTYDPQRDFAPLTLATEMSFVLVAGPSIPVRTLPELIQYGRKTDKLTYATWGVGSSSHLVAELFQKATDVRMTHVPYKGGPAAMTDMIGGQVSLMFALPSDVAPLVKAGKLRALAVTGPKRLPMIPEVPTFGEAGVPDVDLRAWFGFVVPARTPQEICQRLHTELVALINSKEFTDWAASLGVTVVASSPEALAQRIKVDSALAAKLAKSIDLKLED
jgi:tripartite-type tricarboxylate transporter receptor subunit TctC